ncbi:lytic murein transglycosylase [Shimia ponticola]|uniref:lytic murein transglycosylase n=1 Tax=Shimia ponticola TaxID=2582893 RepID=UPI0011BFCA5D|nr:lytic murein transglycosylase [Shimia ponticola]
MRLVLIVLLALATPLAAQTRSEVTQGFGIWLNETVWPEARRAGITRATWNSYVSGLTPDYEIPELVMPGQSAPTHQSQAEFRSPERYFNQSNLSAATRAGRSLAQKHANTLTRIERQTGVPGHFLLAVWSRESAYGRAALPHDALRTLATKGYLSRRPDYFTAEFIAALDLIQRGVPRERMRSSWAGALGQPQFMPSSVRRFARDGDGNGTADIWGSEADTLASIANYLKQSGWVKGRDWGFEVTLPSSVRCTLAGPDQARSIRDWEALGITRVSGRPFPSNERNQSASLLLPAGTSGPAFLVTPNFFVFKEYNESDLYALYVGHLGDKIAFNVGPFSGRWAAPPRLTRGQIVDLQRRLVNAGYDVGGIDGLVGFKTRRAIGRAQEAQGQQPTCWPG